MRGQFVEDVRETKHGYESGELEFILLPEQISTFWEAIKFAYVKSNSYEGDLVPRMLHNLLVELLSGIALCGIVLSKDRKLESIIIIHIVEEETTGDRSLFIDAVYSFLHADQDSWLKKGARLIEYARMNKCKRIKGNTGNKKLHEIIQGFGVTEVYRCYSLDI